MNRIKVGVLISFVLLAVLLVRAESYADEVEKMERVVVTGVGTNTDLAQRNAIRNAVEQVVGLYVTSDTIVESSALIKDEILTHSQGYVKEVRVLSTSNEDGLVTVRVDALVVASQLKDKIKSLNIATKKVDGGSLFAEAATKVEMQKTGVEVLRNVLSKYPQAAYKIEVLKPQIVSTDTDANLASVKVPVIVKLDPVFLEELNSVLDAVSDKKVSNTVLSGYNVYGKLTDSEHDAVCTASKSLLRNGLSNKCFSLKKSMIKKAYSSSATSIENLISFSWKSYSLNILFKDKDGNVVEGSNYSLTYEDSYLRGKKYNNIGTPDDIDSAITHCIFLSARWAPPCIAGDDTYPVFVTDGFMPLDLLANVSIENMSKISSVEVSMNQFPYN